MSVVLLIPVLVIPGLCKVLWLVWLFPLWQDKTMAGNSDIVWPLSSLLSPHHLSRGPQLWHWYFQRRVTFMAFSLIFVNKAYVMLWGCLEIHHWWQIMNKHPNFRKSKYSSSYKQQDSPNSKVLSPKVSMSKLRSSRRLTSLTQYQSFPGQQCTHLTQLAMEAVNPKNKQRKYKWMC